MMVHSRFSKPSSSCHGLVATITLLYLITISVTNTCLAARIEPHVKTNTRFIKSSCGVTMYPKLCFKTLSVYASSIQTSPTELANAALTVSLKGAQATSTTVANLSKGHDLKPSEASAITDCVENMEDSVDELKQSLVAMEDLEGPDFETKMGNILTWVSAALTDEDTCMDGVEEAGMKGKIRRTIRGYIVNVAQLTSNALALVNKLSST
ncbi:21 kDa protein-like [Cornus florida]|uniref:21 kDa protein-like n=1 Tax=Cornus florida TaxID=4283 RepID=UPI002897D64F|nr:21 kDa protein-like [Cornus florida]